MQRKYSRKRSLKLLNSLVLKNLRFRRARVHSSSSSAVRSYWFPSRQSQGSTCIWPCIHQCTYTWKNIRFIADRILNDGWENTLDLLPFYDLIFLLLSFWIWEHNDKACEALGIIRTLSSNLEPVPDSPMPLTHWRWLSLPLLPMIFLTSSDTISSPSSNQTSGKSTSPSFNLQILPGVVTLR